MRFTEDEVLHAQTVVYGSMPPTPQFAWPLLRERVGIPVWVKHENHTPAGAFKIRGGLVYFAQLSASARPPAAVISATRGNHGQSVGWGARKHGLRATIVVPRGNSMEKNAAMRALGVNLVEHGDEFQEAREYAKALAEERGLHMVPSFHRLLVQGVMTYWLEFFNHFPKGEEPDVVYVPIGLGSGFAAAAAARAHTGARSKLVGVVSANATTYLDSFKARKVLASPVSTRIADGLACRVAEEEALAIVLREAEDIVAVADDQIEEAMRILFTDTHNVAEGAGAAGLAAAMQTHGRWKARSVGFALTGGNVDRSVYAEVVRGSA